MLYNDDFLLLHYPKTAGKSVAVYFCKNFDKPIRGRVSAGQVREIAMGPDEGVHLEVTGSHDNFKAAQEVLAAQGIDIYSFKALILPVRNPYDLVISNYFFLKQSYETNPALRERENFALAASSSFSEFCMKSKMADFANFMPPEGPDGRLPVELIPFETLSSSLSRVLAKYGMEETHPLPHLNPSKRPVSVREMYDDVSMGHVEAKMASMFTHGGYAMYEKPELLRDSA